MQIIKNPLARVPLVFLVSISILAQATNKFPYKLSEMPFNATAVERDIDKKCSEVGSAQDEPRKAQNRAKNDLGEGGTPIDIAFSDFDKLERASAAAKNCWKNKLKGCRKLKFEKPVKGSKNK